MHYKFCHFSELHRECYLDGKAISWYAQQGWEHMNDCDRQYIKRHTTNGARVGRKSKQPRLEEKASETEEASSILRMEFENSQLEAELGKQYKHTKAKLKDQLVNLGLPVSGKKTTLITRLVTFQQWAQAKELRRKQRENDPLESALWWRASIIASLFRQQARKLSTL